MQSILTVTTAASTRDFTRLDTVRQELSIRGRQDDALLLRWIRESSAAIEDYLTRRIVLETISEVFRLDHSCREVAAAVPLRLSRWPVTAIASITECDQALQTTDYELASDSGLLWRLCDDRRRPWNWGKVTIAYTAGYELLKTLPRAIEQACLELIKLRWSAKGRDPTVRAERVEGVDEVTYWVGAIGENGALPPKVTALIDSYREPNL